MTGMGAAITALSVPGFIRHAEELIGAIVGLVFVIVGILLRGLDRQPAASLAEGR